MIYNHTAPVSYCIPGCKSYTIPKTWDANFRKTAVIIMAAELQKRTDIADWMIKQLRQMNEGIALLQKQIT